MPISIRPPRTSASTLRDCCPPCGAAASFAGYLGALQERRAYFIERGAVSVDVGVTDPATAELTAPEAESLFQRALTQALSADDQRMIRAHMLLQLAAMSVDDGLVLTIHAGVYRNHSTATFDRFGPDTGHDIPVPTTFTRELRPLLDRFGLEPNLHLILFTVDETTFSRELAPSRASTRVSTSGLRGGFLTPRTQSFAGVQRSPKRRASTALPASSTTPAPSSPYPPGTTYRGAPTHPSWPAM